MVSREVYEALAESHWQATVKGKANPYTSMNGNMFSFLSKEGVLCLRLSASDQTQFWEKHGGGPVEQYGAVMKGYVALPETMLGDADETAHWFEACLENANALPAKATKKKR